MDDLQEKKCRCKLCGALFKDSDMSEEHYPARSTGNDDIVALDIIKMFESLRSSKVHSEIEKRLAVGEKLEDITGNILDTQLTKSLYPKGRTARTLCRKCNTFLGKYDKSYLRFFDLDGNPKAIKGFQRQTKYQIIKAIYAKFISLPETQDEEFDFLDFIRNEDETSYNGTWKLYFVKRDKRSDLMGLLDIGTGKIVFDEGVVYEMSDDKFIFDLMNFPKHACFQMTNIFDILNKNYRLTEGTGKDGGYHAQVLISRLFSQINIQVPEEGVSKLE